jgi:hypothetical protein
MLRRRRPWRAFVYERGYTAPLSTLHEAWVCIDCDCRAAGAVRGARQHPHSVMPRPTSILPAVRRVYLYRCSCAQTTSCPALYRVVVDNTTRPAIFVEVAFQHRHEFSAHRSNRLPHEVVDRIAVLVGQCGVVKAVQLRRFLLAEGLWRETFCLLALRRHLRLHRSQYLRTGFANSCAGLRDLVSRHSLRTRLAPFVGSTAWDARALHVPGCLSDVSAIDDSNGRVWVSFSTLHSSSTTCAA